MKAEQCFACGGEMKLIREAASFEVGRRKAVVQVERYRCAQCAEELYTPAQADAAQIAAADEFRRQDGLLTPGEIKQIRSKYGLTQSELESLLGVGPKTVVRWERGTVFQNQATDKLLRILADVPEVFAYLSKVSGAIAAPPQPATRPESRAGARYRLRTGSERSKVVKITDFRRVKKQKHPVTLPAGELVLPLIPLEELK
jgi:HTH-type transcriptional regulator / antitoxin MqsA